MIAKSIRRLVARFAVAALVFAQIATTAYGCPLQDLVTPPALTHGSTHAGAGPCAGIDAAPVNTQTNACEFHCTDGIAAAVQPDLPPVVLAALPAGTFAIAAPGSGAASPQAPIVPLSGAPPLALRFCRLLI